MGVYAVLPLDVFVRTHQSAPPLAAQQSFSGNEFRGNWLRFPSQLDTTLRNGQPIVRGLSNMAEGYQPPALRSSVPPAGLSGEDVGMVSDVLFSVPLFRAFCVEHQLAMAALPVGRPLAAAST